MPNSDIEGQQDTAQSIRAASISARREEKMMRQPLVFYAALGIALGVTAANKPIVGLITKTNRLVRFMDYDLGYFDDETCRLEPLANPFGPKVLPMSSI
jgi:hypothetical protein